MELPWREDVAAVLVRGPRAGGRGRAAAVLYGDRDPSGRLPVTFAPEGEYPTAGAERRYPGVDDEVHYDEDVVTATDTSTTKTPTRPIRSVTAFVCDDRIRRCRITGERTVAVPVKNAADRPGREVIQAYVRPPSVDGVDRPRRELAGFEAVQLDADDEDGSTDADDLAFSRYDPNSGWTVDTGTYTVEIGRSSRDIRSRIEHR